MKTVIVVVFAALSAAIGESMLSYGMKRSGSVDIADPSHWAGLILSVVRNPYIFAGVIFLAVFFFLYLAALSWADLSFVLPLTAVSYIFAALIARFVLKEEVSLVRWIGTVVIMLGIALVALDGRQRTAVGGPADRETGKNLQPRNEGKGAPEMEAVRFGVRRLPGQDA